MARPCHLKRTTAGVSGDPYMSAEEAALWKEAADRDFEQFLLNRARELMKGKLILLWWACDRHLSVPRSLHLTIVL